MMDHDALRAHLAQALPEDVLGVDTFGMQDATRVVVEVPWPRFPRRLEFLAERLTTAWQGSGRPAPIAVRFVACFGGEGAPPKTPLADVEGDGLRWTRQAMSLLLAIFDARARQLDQMRGGFDVFVGEVGEFDDWASVQPDALAEALRDGLGEREDRDALSSLVSTLIWAPTAKALAPEAFRDAVVHLVETSAGAHDWDHWSGVLSRHGGDG